MAAEGEHNRFISVTLSPGSLSGNIMGHVVPLTTEQFGSYTFNTSRTVPQGVQQAINDISDPAECEHHNRYLTQLLKYYFIPCSDEEGVDGRKDFNNSIIYFTLPAGNEEYEIPVENIIIDDTVNEAQESFILVLEIDSVGSADMVELDAQYQGIHVFRINDNDGMFMELTL